MKTKLFYLFFTITLISCQEETEHLPFYNTADFTAEWIDERNPVYPSIHKIAAFEFTNQLGAKISNKTLAGKIYIANFFFTTCPSICPKMTDNMSMVQKEFKDDEDILLLSHSVMPWVDNSSTLEQYAKENNIINSKWHLLTGEKEEIYSLARSSYFAEKRIGFQRGNQEFLHTENLILIDHLGRIRGIYNGTLPLEMERLIEAIHVLKKELT